ncbi:putative methyltransferase DDB_G0268948 [Apostichopus japonicus]|uniref:putative methyltransferase DDB_G0268948 n=1 Tax=Stichopus japonicus TaxID=307972 RepID=UPI003AB78752
MSSHQEDTRLFQGKDHSVTYQRYRPKYEGYNIVEKFMTFLQEQCPPPYQLALDLGCGSGQSAHLLASHFKEVIGIDCSEEQIKAAQGSSTLTNVSFRCGDESSLGSIQDGSVDLITCAQSIHWMDLDVLYKEMDRILKPGGCLAAYGYHSNTVHVTDDHLELETQLQDIVQEINDWIMPYWSEKINLIYSAYKDLPLPFTDNKRYVDEVKYQEMNAEGVFGLIESFSAYQIAIKKHTDGTKRFRDYRKKFVDCIRKYCDQPEEYKLKYSSNHFLVLSRKPANK